MDDKERDEHALKPPWNEKPTPSRVSNPGDRDTETTVEIVYNSRTTDSTSISRESVQSGASGSQESRSTGSWNSRGVDTTRKRSHEQIPRGDRDKKARVWQKHDRRTNQDQSRDWKRRRADRSRNDWRSDRSTPSSKRNSSSRDHRSSKRLSEETDPKDRRHRNMHRRSRTRSGDRSSSRRSHTESAKKISTVTDVGGEQSHVSSVVRNLQSSQDIESFGEPLFQQSQSDSHGTVLPAFDQKSLHPDPMNSRPFLLPNPGVSEAQQSVALDGCTPALQSFSADQRFHPIPMSGMHQSGLSGSEVGTSQGLSSAGGSSEQQEIPPRSLLSGSEAEGRVMEYIAALEHQKALLEQKVSDLSNKQLNDGQIIELIKENIEKVRLTQEQEKIKLETEKKKLEEAKADLKSTLNQGVQMLEAERMKMEAEIKEKRNKFEKEMEQRKLAICHTEAGEVDRLKLRLHVLEKEKEMETETRKEEEKRHTITELTELEIGRSLTNQALEYESRIEELESKIKRLEGGGSDHHTEMKTPQMRSSDVGELSVEKQRHIETKAEMKSNESRERRESGGAQLPDAPLSDEPMRDQASARRTQCPQAETLEDIKERNNSTIKKFKDKIFQLKKDVDSLLSIKKTQEKELKELKDRNHVLNNQNKEVHSAVTEKLKSENTHLKNQMEQLNIELSEMEMLLQGRDYGVQQLQGQLARETSAAKMHKTRVTELGVEKETLKKRIVSLESSITELRLTARSSSKCYHEERTTLKKEIHSLQSQIKSANETRKSLESEIAELKEENKSIRDLRSELSDISLTVGEQVRLENKSLHSRVSVLQTDKKSLKKELGKTLDRIQEMEVWLQEAKSENKSLSERLNELQQANDDLAEKMVHQEETNLKMAERIEILTQDKRQLEEKDPAPIDLNTMMGDLHQRIDKIALDAKLSSTPSRESGSYDNIYLLAAEGDKITHPKADSAGHPGLQELKEDLFYTHSKPKPSTMSSSTHDEKHTSTCDCASCDTDVDYLWGFDAFGQPHGTSVK